MKRDQFCYSLSKVCLVILLGISVNAFSVTTINTVDSTNSGALPTTVNPYAVLTIETGKVSSSIPTFSTTKLCPPSFSPYITIAASNIPAGPSQWLASVYRTCIASVTTTSTGYTATVTGEYAHNNYSSANSNSGKYISDDSGAFVWGTTNKEMPDTSTIGTVIYSIYDAAYDFTWVLYCYPPGSTVPTNTNTCT